ncbi:MAG: hypothetical protein E7Z99_07150 [Coriobacteriaceae bacterium]|jgi:hypothetical protein|nr:hypothetical protein [Coriobacteriaceae bacterium]
MAFFKKQGKHAKGSAAGSEEQQPEHASDGNNETEQQANEQTQQEEPAAEAAEEAVEAAEAAEAAETADQTEVIYVDERGYPVDDAVVDPSAFVAAGFEEPSKKRRRALKAVGITFGVIIGVLLVAYIAGAVVFMGRFLPNTAVAGQDVSLKSNEEVVKVLEDAVSDYRIDVVCGNFSYRTTGPQVGMTIDSNAIISAMHEDLNPWLWPKLILEGSHDETGLITVRYNESALNADFNEKVAQFNETAKPPTDATIAYNETTKSFQVKPEEIGTMIDANAAVARLDSAVGSLQTKLELTKDELVQPKVFSTDEKLVESAKVATGLVSADVKLNMGGKQVGEVNGKSLSGFVTIDENYEVKFNEEGLDAWIAELADGYNTVGTERKYTRADGKQVTVSGGVYGWEIDNDALKETLLEAVKTGQVTTIDVPCYTEAEVYTGKGERDWGNRYIDVDLSEQYVRFYGDDGSIVWESPCISGAPDGEHDTKLGVWFINNKEAPSKLIGYEHGKKIYETMVNYWMAFEGSGIGLHDATWQPSFGGNMYAEGYGSHGCVNLPYDAAQELYGMCQIGDVVIVHW